MTAVNLLFAQGFADAASRQGIDHSFTAFTGESFGILSAAVAAGALTVGDGIRVAEAFTPLMLMTSSVDAMDAQSDDEFLARLRAHLPSFAPGSYPVEEPMHVIGLIGEPEHLRELLREIEHTISPDDVEVHKKYSWRQVNVYARNGFMPRFERMLERFPLVEARELKEPTTFCAHSERMYVVRHALSSWMADERIVFSNPHTPVIANHGQATLTTSDEIRDAVLAMTNRVMDSEGMTQEIVRSDPHLLIELGPGARSLQLLEANGVEIPAAAWTGHDEAILSATSLITRLHRVLKKLRTCTTAVGPSELDLVREIVRQPADSLAMKCAQRITSDAVTDLVSKPRREEEAGLRRFLDLVRYTLAHRNEIDVHGGDLVTRARLKKSPDSDPTILRQAATELEVLQADGTITSMALTEPVQAEAVVFYFDKPLDIGPVDIVRAARKLTRSEPVADKLWAELNAATTTLSLAGLSQVSLRIAVAFVTHRLAMFELVRVHRPSLIAHTDHNLAGGDRFGWLLSLAAAGCVPPARILPLVALLLDHDADPIRTGEEIDVLTADIGDAEVPVLSPVGTPLWTSREIQEATIGVLREGALERPERSVRLNGACLVISLGSVLAPYRVSSFPHPSKVVSVQAPVELWRKGINHALDREHEKILLVRSHEREHIARYARQRRLLSSTVNGYIERGETVVGFGAGGSESMTMFIEPDGEPQVLVRKVLSDALITAPWDPNGVGTMLPPFAKAQRQAEYLQALPEHLRNRFPSVRRSSSRDQSLPVNQQQQTNRTREFMYEMSYVPGIAVGRWIEKFSPPPKVVARVYEVIMSVLHHEVHSSRRQPAPGDTLEEQYFSKIERRLDLCRRTAPSTFGSWLLDTDFIRVNGRILRNITPLLAEFRSIPEYRKLLEPRFHSLVMGDTNTENIKIADIRPLRRAQRVIESAAANDEIHRVLQAITAERIGLQFLDPRAIGYKSSGADTRDDPMYDNKPWHNSLGHYDEIHNELFDLKVDVVDGMPSIDVTFTPGNPYQRSYRVRDVFESGHPIGTTEGMESYFAPVMRSVYALDDPESAQYRDDPHWLIRFVFMMGTHFTAMPPFHFLSEVDGSLTDDPLSQRRPVVIYAEGIKWLNWALDMLEGARTEFLGLPVFGSQATSRGD